VLEVLGERYQGTTGYTDLEHLMDVVIPPKFIERATAGDPITDVRYFVCMIIGSEMEGESWFWDDVQERLHNRVL
jgi:hypothetical protein